MGVKHAFAMIYNNLLHKNIEKCATKKCCYLQTPLHRPTKREGMHLLMHTLLLLIT